MGEKTELPDLNLPIEHSSSSMSPIQLHNFVPIPSLAPDNNQDNYDGDSSFMSFLRENMQQFWSERLTEISSTSGDPRRQLLLRFARVKRMMKSVDKVERVSGEAPVLLAKSMELFVMELTFRAWLHAQKDNRSTLHDCDIARAIKQEELLALLLSNVINVHDLKEETDHPKETESQVAGPGHLHDVNSDFYTRKPEIVEQFSSSMSSVPSIGRPGSDVAITSLMSSLPSNYCPGSEVAYAGNPGFAEFPPSSPSMPSDHRPGSE